MIIRGEVRAISMASNEFPIGEWKESMESVIFYHICKLVDLIQALHQSDCRIPNWVSAKTVNNSSTTATTVKLPHAYGHSSGNRQGHRTKTKTHRFEIFVAFTFANV